jgi:hypothetical protein
MLILLESLDNNNRCVISIAWRETYSPCQDPEGTFPHLVQQCSKSKFEGAIHGLKSR